MTFALAQEEVRSRLIESAAMLSHIRTIASPDFQPASNLEKSLRGLWLVALYGALEKGTNAVVDAAIGAILSQGEVISSVNPKLQSLLQYRFLQSVRDSGPQSFIDKSVKLFQEAFSNENVTKFDNHLSKYLQNVDGGTLLWVSTLFGISEFSIEPQESGRLANLRERRNAVAHGRELASEVGERFQVSEMEEYYRDVESVVQRFSVTLEEFCEGRRYLARRAA